MCGIACYYGNNKEEGLVFGTKSLTLLRHRGPDDKGIFNADEITLVHTRLSILELSQLGHQPMESSCGRYIIVYNGEIYNHLELRRKYLADHQFKGHSDSETIIELFCVKKEQMLAEMVGIWALIIWDKQEKKIFISRDRFGQKPLYLGQINDAWLLSSEVTPLLRINEDNPYNPTALVEYLALGNYGHLGTNTFYNNIQQFPVGSYCWLTTDQKTIKSKKYWELPEISEKEKVPFDKTVQKGLHDCIVEAVISQTLSDVPLGITLSGGIDSSIIAGILAQYYDKKINIFTAQSAESKYDETRFVDDVIKMHPGGKFIVHKTNLDALSIKDNLEKYIKIQEEPFGDPSIIAHGFLMSSAAKTGVKVILNGQGADEVFFGYNNMVQAVLSKQLKNLQFKKLYDNLRIMNLGNKLVARSLLESFLPGLEYSLRKRSRINRRNIINDSILKLIDNTSISLHKYNNTYNVWKESMYGVHIPHLVHYDDRNGMANGVEGRMPFLDHRVAEYAATIRNSEFLKNGLRKYILRQSCKQYIPESVYQRKDKIGFYTPLVSIINKERTWITEHLRDNKYFKAFNTEDLLTKLNTSQLNVHEALQVWRCLSAGTWVKEFNIRN